MEAPVAEWSWPPAPCRCRAAPRQASAGRAGSRRGPARSRHDGLDQVPVDGVPVHRVALRPAPHRGPLGQPALDDAGQVEPLPDGDERRARPRAGRRRGRARPGPRRRAAAVLCRRGWLSVVGDSGRPARAATTRRPQRQQRVRRPASADGPSTDLAVVLEEAVAEGRQLRSARADAQGAGALRLRRPGGPSRRAA